MKQKIINILGVVFIGLNIIAVSVLTFAYFHHQKYKNLRLENNKTFPKTFSNYSNPRCNEGNFFSTLFDTEK